MKGEGRGGQIDPPTPPPGKTTFKKPSLVRVNAKINEVKGEIPSIKKLLLLLLLLLKIKYLMLVIYFLKKLTITQNLIKILKKLLTMIMTNILLPQYLISYLQKMFLQD